MSGSEEYENAIRRGKAKVKLKNGQKWDREGVELHENWVIVPSGGLEKCYPADQVEEVFFR